MFFPLDHFYNNNNNKNNNNNNKLRVSGKIGVLCLLLISKLCPFY